MCAMLPVITNTTIAAHVILYVIPASAFTMLHTPWAVVSVQKFCTYDNICHHMTGADAGFFTPGGTVAKGT